MGRLYLAFFCFIVACSALCGQEVQWASEIITVSSQKSSEGHFSAKQILGVPNAMSSSNVQGYAWTPSKDENTLPEYIRVAFKKPMPIQQIAIAESNNPGAISKIFLFSDKGKKHLVYENPKPSPLLVKQRLFLHKFTQTDYNVAELRLELKTKAVSGPNNIDAIGISSSRRSIKIDIEEVSFGNEIQAAENLGPGVNSPFAERLPIISPDGQTLYFARKYHPQNIGEDDHDDIWVSYRQPDDSWSRAVNMGAPLNNKTHNFVVSVNPAQDILYLANDYRSNAKDAVSFSEKKGRSWEKPKTLDIDDHYNKNEFVGYYVNMKGNILLMSVERKEGFGERDLYVSFLDGKNTWSKPRNLGPTINTINEESSIFLAADGKTIYFSSNGHEGYGGLDMYMSKRLDHTWTKWTKPKNMGQKINSTANDYNYSIPASGEYAYFSSDDPNGMSDLYRIKLPKEFQPEPVMMVSGRIIDAETKQPIQAKIKYQNLGKKGKDEAISAKDDGAFQIVLPFGDDVGLHAEVEGYFSVSENMQLSDQSLEQEDYDDNTYASIDNNPVNKEVEALQLRLNTLNQEIEDIQTQRTRTKENILKTRRAKKNINKPSTRKSDPELDALKDKYDRLKTKKTALQIRNEQKDRKKTTPKSGDADLEAMKNKLSKHHDESNTRRSPNKKFNYGEKDKDDELAKMKEKLNRHHNDTPIPDDEVAMIPGESLEEEEEVPNNNLENEIADFEEVEALIRKNLMDQLRAPVKLELQKEMIEDIKKELEEEMDEGLRKDLKSKLKYEKELRKELEEQLKKELKENLAEEVKKELRGELMEEIEEELRIALEDEVRKELRNELYDVVKAELRQEMEFRLKKEIEDDLRKELKNKVLEQEKEEQKKRKAKTTEELPTTRPKPVAEVIPAPKYQELKTDILLIPIKEGQIIPMNNIFFEANKASIKEKSDAELQRVKLFLERNQNMVVEIGGHTNGWCSHEFASELSRSRAKSVAQHLIENGIPEYQIQHKGYGKTAPIASNDTLAGRKKNQRVEMKILEIK